ncbi:hypothetical protein [Ruania alba]|uniref:Uncharacterized protein n=1 Tax=Ruania alba TaxID=648782 RepID=A0A1H5KNN0_9MICO|nr:hypothetical protein [Ruania alba]SEE65578.1 hypothetical protein SAMN04488554_2330 [Ruania alba]
MSSTPATTAEHKATPAGPKPRVAVILTTYFRGSHSDVVVGRLLDGYIFEGKHQEPQVEVVSAYLELLGDPYGGDDPRHDIGVGLFEQFGIPMFDSVAEALGLGEPGVAVDAVLVIGEHGGYEENMYGQRLYPRKRLVDAVISTMWGAGQFAPVFTDKQLAWRTRDAFRMVEDCRRFGVPLMAGSSIPLAWRTGDETWPAGATMDAAVVVGFGGADIYGTHLLELGQSFTERRAGGESGVEQVLGLTGDQARAALNEGRVDRGLYQAALATVDLSPEHEARIAESGIDVFEVIHRDGLRTWIVIHEGLNRFGVAARGPHISTATRVWAQRGPAFGHFSYLVRNIERFFVSGKPAWPTERVLLVSGILDAAMRSRHASQAEGTPAPVATPELDTTYQHDDSAVIHAHGLPVIADSE